MDTKTFETMTDIRLVVGQIEALSYCALDLAESIHTVNDDRANMERLSSLLAVLNEMCAQADSRLEALETQLRRVTASDPV